MESRCLKGCAHDDQAHRHPDHASSTADIANDEVDDASEEGSQAVAGNSDTSDHIACLKASFAFGVFK